MFFLDHTKSAALRILSRALARWSKSVDERRNPVRMPELFDEFKNLQFSGHAIQKLLGEFEFGTVLDIGSGEGHHTDVFIRHGKPVTAIDYGKSIYFEKRAQERRLEAIVANFNDATFDRQFDCIWCSHVLEHQLDPHSFLRKVHSLLKEGGILAITVPPFKHEIVGGHISLWNGGMLLYRLVLAGFNCRTASLLRYGYNISVIVRKDTIDVLQEIAYDSGDIRRIKSFLPADLPFQPKAGDDPFDGDIQELNWINHGLPARTGT